MRVLIASEFFNPVPGGRESAVAGLGAALARRGHDVTVATLALPGLPLDERIGSVQVRRIRATLQRVPWIYKEAGRPHVPPVPDPVTVRDLGRVLAESRPDIVHAHDWLVHSLLPVARRRGTPVVLSIHDASMVCATKRLMQGTEPCSGPAFGKCVACAFRNYGITGPPLVVALSAGSGRIERGVDRFLPVSQTVAEQSGLARHGLSFEVIPNFLPDETFEEPPPGGESAATISLLPSDYLLFVGDATADKGIDVLLEAHRRLEARLPLVTVGRPLSRSLTTSSGDVIVLGPQSHGFVLEVLRRCTIAVVPSLVREAFGLAALEAMAMGRPVVASRTGGLADLVVDGETGLLTPPGDAPALADAIGRLLGDEPAREAMGAAGRRRAQEFSEDKVVPRLERIYETLLRPAGRAA